MEFFLTKPLVAFDTEPFRCEVDLLIGDTKLTRELLCFGYRLIPINECPKDELFFISGERRLLLRLRGVGE